MMLKITSVCSMGCTHCISDCKPHGIHMPWNVLFKAVKYIQRNNSVMLIVSGGEPTEHPDFFNMIEYIMNNVSHLSVVTVTTNGAKMNGVFADHMLEMLDKYDNLLIQVTNVKEYYPVRIDTSHRIFKHENVALCEEIEYIYPQGRAADNNLPWKSKGSKCVNARIIPKQMVAMYKKPTMMEVARIMALNGLSCTPFIDPEGNIKLGESDLCPVCATIYDTDEEIMNKIINFKCSRCDFINKEKLPLAARQFLKM